LNTGKINGMPGDNPTDYPGSGIRSLATLPGETLLNHPDLPAVSIPGFDNPVCEWRIDEPGFLFYRLEESGFRSGIGSDLHPADRM
jgi:hypothetical protein